jgi:hypothetical protein
MNIIELAQECLLLGMRPHMGGIYQDALEKFAELVAAQEREACAEIAEAWDKENKLSNYGGCIALRIRARGTT